MKTIITPQMTSAINSGLSFKKAEQGSQEVSELTRSLYQTYTKLVGILTNEQQTKVMDEVRRLNK